MVLRYERLAFNSYFGYGCTIAGHPVATRPLNGVTITRPPFERLSNFLGLFPNEVGIAGLPSFYSNAPLFGKLPESVPFYGWDPVNYDYDGQKDGTRAGIAALLSDLVFNGLDGVRKRSLMVPPRGEHPLNHVNVDGFLTNLPGRAKSVLYTGGLTDGYPTFLSFQTAPATLSINSIATDNYTVVKASTVNYTSLRCYLIDALENLKLRVDAGLHDTAPANAGVSAMKFAESYSDLSWELVQNDPYAVRSISYTYTCTLTNAPLFSSEVSVYRIRIAWEDKSMQPWIGTGVAPVALNLLTVPRAKVIQTFTSELIDLVVTDRQSNTVLYQYGGISPAFVEIFERPIHATSAKENYVEKYSNVVALLSHSGTHLGGAIPGKRLDSFHSEVQRDLANLQTTRFLSFTEAVGQCIEGVNTNFLENFTELQQTLKLVDFSSYMEKVNKIKKSGGNPVELLDVLSSTYLMVKYGIAPLLSDAQELYTQLLPAITQIRNLTEREFKAYGTFSMSLPIGTYGYKTVRVVASSKVVGHFNLSTFFLGAYLIDATGFMPSFERLWDLVQYSFLADMFFNVDDRLKIFDDGIRTAGFVLRYHTSTLHIYAEIDDETLTYHGLKGNGTSKPRLVYHTRNISKYAPRLGTTVYDVVPPGNQDWFSIGALIFQSLNK